MILETTTISGRPDGTRPLTGAERVPMDQGEFTIDATTQDIANLAIVNISQRLAAFRDASCFYVSKRITASDSNNGTSDGEPFLTIGAAVAAAKAYVLANPGKLAKVHCGPGTFTEASLPFRPGPGVLVYADSQRTTIIKPATGQELNGFFALDSGAMLVNLTFAGHQATGTSATDSSIGTRAWAVRFDELANGGQGPILYASPYVKDCLSITAEDDAGLAGSTSVGDTGGGIEIDGAKCHPNSPVRSMVVYGYTQQNLGGPGIVIKNDAYGELVSFFGLFCTWHVQAEKGGWATMSGGGCSEFGTYGVVADGYSPSALFTGTLRASAAAGALSVDVMSMTANRIGSSSRPHNGLIMLLGGTGYVVSASSPINSSGTVVSDSDVTRAGYRVTLYNPSGIGLATNAAQGATCDFRRRSQVSAGCHTALFVGSGNNYQALPWNGGVPVRANEFVERNFGRVFGLRVNDAGDITAAGGAFSIDGTSGAVTINTSQFNLSGLNAIGPFSRNGYSPVGVQIQEASNNVTLLSSLGSSDGNTVPTQFAVRSYSDNRYLAGLSVTNGQPIAITDNSTQDANGYWTRSRNISLNIAATGDASTNQLVLGSDSRLSNSREWSAATVSQVDAQAGTSTSRAAFTPQRVFQAIAAWWAASTGATGRSVAIAATQSDGRTALGLGSAAVAATTDFATAAQGGLANTAVQPSGLSGYVQTSDSRLSDARTPTEHSQAWSTITGTPTTISGYGITDSFTQANVRSTPLTGYVSSSGTIAASDSILTAIQKLNGNITAAVAGSVTNVTATSPIVSSGGATPNLSISAATTSVAGYMSSSDKSKLNGIAAGATAFDPTSPGAIGDTTAAAGTFTSLTATGRVIKSVNGAASAPPVSLTGTWFSGGTTTTTKPQFLVEPDGTTSAAWSTAGTGIGVNASSGFIGNLLDLQVNGVSYLVIGKNKIVIGRNANYVSFAGGTDSGEAPTGACGNGGFRVTNSNFYAWSSSLDTTLTPDLRLYRDSANTLAQRNGTSGQVSRIYRTYTDASNYERVGLDVSSNTFTFGPQAAGTGTLRPFYISTGSTTVASLASAATVGAGSRAFVTDATATTFLSTVAGGGSNKVPVVSDGTNWLIG